MGAVSIRALGPLQIVVDGVPVVVGAGKPRIVLCGLLLRANSLVRSEVLVEAVWGDHAPAAPGPQLQVYVANLRRLLDPDREKGVASQRLASRPGGYVFTAETDELDLLEFRDLVGAGERAVEAGDVAAAGDMFRRAVQLCRGPVFPDLVDIPLFRAELDGWEETRLRVYQDLADIELALGRHAGLVGELQALVAEHPYRERLWASLVVALYRSDRQADALAACRDARRMLAEELGIDPGPRLRHLEQSVLRNDPSLDAPPSDGHRRVRQRVDNLPAELTPLIGRDTDLAELSSMYAAEGCRLVTVTGPGGTGKTRLALAAARQLGAGMIDGVCWVDLAPLTAAGQVPPAIASALGLEEMPGSDPLAAAAQFLRTRHTLLVLDNFEHLEPAWPVVLDLLTAAAELRVLISSRRPLGLRAECEYQLAPLTVPPPGSPASLALLQDVPAVRLFVTRGRAARRGFGVTGDNATTVSRICRRLDGLPLAIELAAAQLRVSGEQALLNDLESSLTALPEALRDLPDRQRTLTATITWSYQLLAESEQVLFDRLGVFAADPTVEAVNAICGEPARAADDGDNRLTALARHSLLRRYTDPSATHRVSMLQTIRAFARDQLSGRADAADVSRRHAEYHLTLAQTLGPLLWGAGQVKAFQRLHAARLDLRGALLWAIGPDGPPDLALRLVAALWHYWELTDDVAEQSTIVLDLISRSDDAPAELIAPVLSGAATMCWMLGRNDQATDLHHQAHAAFRRCGNARGVAWSTMCLATLAVERNEPAAARRLAEEAISSPHAAPRTCASAAIVVSMAAFYAGDHAESLLLCRDSLRLVRPLGDRWLLELALLNLADATAQAGDYQTAESLLHEALRTVLDLAAQGHLIPILESVGGVDIKQHRFEQAIRVLAAADAYRADRGLPLNTAERGRIEPLITEARTAAGPLQFALAWAAGQSTSLDQIVQEVLGSGHHGAAGTEHNEDHQHRWPTDTRTAATLPQPPHSTFSALPF